MAYKIIQWGTGALGSLSLREILQHPDLELAGLRVYNREKVGQDAGLLAGMAPTGIFATDQIEDILAIKADCVLYMAQARFSMDEHDSNICRLLESGKNVIASTGYYWPPTMAAPMWKCWRLPASAAIRHRSALASAPATSPSGLPCRLPKSACR